MQTLVHIDSSFDGSYFFLVELEDPERYDQLGISVHKNAKEKFDFLYGVLSECTPLETPFAIKGDVCVIQCEFCRYDYSYARWIDRFRYDCLMKNECRLTQAEIEEGWHFCPEWDGLLIHPNDKETEACTCASA